MLKKLSVIWILLVAINASVFADSEKRQFVLNNTEIISIKSKYTGRNHELVIVYPASYKASPDKKYPVFYYLDAYWDTPLLSATYGNLIYDNEVPEFIMVGFSYPASANVDIERKIDYTFTEADAQSGKAAQFLQFIKQEVAPLIESQYRGDKHNRVLGGVSLGGLFTLSSAYSDPEYFSGYISISPAAQWDNQALSKLDASYAAKNNRLKARMFVSYGTAEYKPFRDPIIEFQKQLAGRKYQGLELLNYSMQDLDHVSVKGDGFVRGLKWVFKPLKPTGPSGLERAITGRN